MATEAENLFAVFAAWVALGVELAAILAVAAGSFEAILAAFRDVLIAKDRGSGRAIWVRFATWILLSLEFALGADIIRTAIAPSWNDISQLAAIAAIRTFLNYFLAKDIEAARARVVRSEPSVG